MTAGRALPPRTLRGRLTLLFGASTFLLSALVGVTVFVQFRSGLVEALDDGLHVRIELLRQQVAEGSLERAEGSTVSLLPESESFAQVLTPEGKVLAASPKSLATRSALTRPEIAAGLRGDHTTEQPVHPKARRARLLYGPGPAGPEPVVVMVGTSLDDTLQAERRLELSLLIGIPVLAALVSLGGWFLVGAALAPVGAMIEEADELAIHRGGARLSVPTGGLELQELARRLNDLLARIEASIAHERAFLDDASHELRTPIALIQGEVELARMSAGEVEAPEREELVASLDSALEEVDRLARLADSLLVLARTRAAGARDADILDLGDVARRAVDNLERTHVEPHVTLTVEGASTVLGDATAFERAVTNVLTNAVRHARNRVEVSLRTERAAEGHERVLEVADDGPGFPPELLGRVFDRFTRGASAGGDDGAGLGLAIAAAIVVAHGGHATASNAASGGAVVQLRVPAR